MTNTDMEDTHLTAAKVAENLGVTSAAVRRWLREGKLQGFQAEGIYQSPWIIMQSEVDAAIEEGRINPDETRGRPRSSIEN